jgi:hypothetical protein
MKNPEAPEATAQAVPVHCKFPVQNKQLPSASLYTIQLDKDE